jgi:DNA-binding NtrC family response regulator
MNSTANSPAPHNAATILIIEDDPRQLSLYAKALRDYRLTTVNSASKAVQSLAVSMPDLIILDNVLDGSERGLDFLPRLKTIASHVPVIVISGSLNVKQQLAALSGPRAAHYALEKPVDIDELERTVEIALTECGMAEMNQTAASPNA